MAEWSKDHVVVIGSLTLNIGTFGRLWLHWRPGGALRWKVKTVGWEGRGVVCGKPAPFKAVAPVCVGYGLMG
jgi:hypothetical protein